MYLASDIGICVKLFCRNVRYSCTACKSDTWARQHLCGIFAFPLGGGRTISSHIDIDLSNLFDFRIHSIVFSIYHIRLAHGCTSCTRYVRKKNYNRPEVHPNRNMRFLPLGKNRQQTKQTRLCSAMTLYACFHAGDGVYGLRIACVSYLFLTVNWYVLFYINRTHSQKGSPDLEFDTMSSKVLNLKCWAHHNSLCFYLPCVYQCVMVLNKDRIIAFPVPR